MNEQLSRSVTFNGPVPLVERLRRLLPPAGQEWADVDYTIQEAIAALSETGAWKDADKEKPAHSNDVLVWHCLGDRSGCDHAYDVACWLNGKWIFPWDRAGQAPQWVRKWKEIERV